MLAFINTTVRRMRAQFGSVEPAKKEKPGKSEKSVRKNQIQCFQKKRQCFPPEDVHFINAFLKTTHSTNAFFRRYVSPELHADATR